MIKEIVLNTKKTEEICTEILSLWSENENKVIVIRNKTKINDVKLFYEKLIKKIGKPYYLAEDALIKDRSLQRTGELWSDIRYDSAIKDAYRHSSNAQPLHTDGSYIPSFPNATLMCCKTNTVDGGETIFLNGNDLICCLKQENISLLNSLSSSSIVHERSGDIRKHKVIDLENNPIKLNWNYYCLQNGQNNKSPFLENFFSYLKSSKLIKNKIKMIKTNPGDAMIWKDSEVLHGRNSFKVIKKNSQRHLHKCAIDVGNFA